MPREFCCDLLHDFAIPPVSSKANLLLWKKQWLNIFHTGIIILLMHDFLPLYFFPHYNHSVKGLLFSLVYSVLNLTVLVKKSQNNLQYDLSLLCHILFYLPDLQLFLHLHPAPVQFLLYDNQDIYSDNLYLLKHRLQLLMHRTHGVFLHPSPALFRLLFLLLIFRSVLTGYPAFHLKR